MDWLQIGQTLGVPLLVLAAVYALVGKFLQWAKPHADNYMADIRANSAATRELVKTLEATQAAMTYQLQRIGECQEMLARSDQRTSRAINRMALVMETHPCIGPDGVRQLVDSDQISEGEDSDAGSNH